MSVDAYINPDFTIPQKLFFFLAAFLMIIVCIVIITGFSSVMAFFTRNKDDVVPFNNANIRRIQLFFEMIISGASVLSFSCSYIIFNHIYSLLSQGIAGYSPSGIESDFVALWENGKDFILLLLICLSCILNTLLDRLIIPLKAIDKDEKASIRLLAMFYVIIILVFLNRIGDRSEYSPVMMYYLGLMVGRFIYFDASFMDFLLAIKNALKNVLLLILALAVLGILCFLGFNLGFLLERNYYIVGVFYTNLFLLAAVFIIHLGMTLKRIITKPSP